MSSLIDRTIQKKLIVKTLTETLKEKNLIANFKDPKWKVLNENEPTKIINVELNQQKDSDDVYFLSFYYLNPDSPKVERINFRLFNTEISKNLEHIRTCDLSYFIEPDTKSKNKNDNDVDLE